MNKITIEVNVAPKSYDIYIGNDIINEIAKQICEKRYGTRYAIITDTTVRDLYGDKLLNSFRNLKVDVNLFAFQAGEAYKTRETKAWLDEQLLNLNFTRDCAIIALGGGVVGDVAGFAAATYMRGIPVIQIPTTVIAQGDSSIGGKTAIDVPQGKNLIGVFHHPKAVFIDINTLNSLDERNYNSGFMEIIKHGIIKNSDFLQFIEDNIDIIMSRNSKEYPEVMIQLMNKNCKVKNDVVLVDDTEKDLRKILNYGHTVGHAVEFLSNYSLLHGEALSIGIACEAYLSFRLGYSSEYDFNKQLNIIKQFGLSYEIPKDIKTDDIMKIMCLDKKARLSEPEFVLLEAIGKTKIFGDGKSTTKIGKEMLFKFINEFRNKEQYTIID